MTLIRIGLSLGDPGGVGPEIAMKVASSWRSEYPRHSLVIFGDRGIIKNESKTLGVQLAFEDFPSSGQPGPGVYIKHVPCSIDKVLMGGPCAENGAASFRFFEEAVDWARAGRGRAVVTAPISKLAWSLAGIRWRGHTEYLAESYPAAVMSFWSDRLKVALFTHHIPLSEAVLKVKKDGLFDFMAGLDRSLDGSPARPKEFLVAGLNPHAGEDGVLGREEIEEIIPAMDKAKSAGVLVSGPYPPDTVFLKALDDPEKMVIALYHDQGLIGFKLVSFASGVNATIGLPFIRTSPDHGTAFDIAGKGIADESSLKAAIKLAVELTGTEGRGA